MPLGSTTYDVDGMRDGEVGTPTPTQVSTPTPPPGFGPTPTRQMSTAPGFRDA